MKYTFGDLQTYFANARGFQSFSSDLDAQTQTHFKVKCNELYEFIWFYKQWSFSGREFQFTTVAPYTTGTVSGAAGQPVLTGASTSWPAQSEGVPLRGQLILIGSDLYRIKDRISTTSLILDGNIRSTIASSTSYKIYFVNYPVRWDIGPFRKADINSNPLGFSSKQVQPASPSYGTPEIIFPSGLTEEDYYNTGTAAVTNGSRTVVITTGTPAVDWIGKAFTLVGTLDIYYIVNFSGANLTLDRPYTGTTNASASYAVQPVGTPMYGLTPYSEQRDLISVNYTFQPPLLVASTDRTLLPSDVPLLYAIDALATKWEASGEQGFVNEFVYNDQKFIESLRVLDRRGTTLNTRLLPFNSAGGRVAEARDSNPWNRRV